MDTRTPADLLRAAARLVRQAVGKLDTTSTPCSECHRPKHRRVTQAHVYTRVSEIPNRLDDAAKALEQDERLTAAQATTR